MTQVLNDQGQQVITTGGAGTSYHHVQGVASALWVVNHNLGYRPGGIHIEDSSGNDIEADIVYLDENNLTIGFSTGATSGDAYLS